MRRLQRIDGLHVNCRHLVGNFCQRYEATIENCDGCRTCPNCNGAVALYKVIKIEGQLRNYRYQTKTCVMCGAWFEDGLTGDIIPDDQRCSVHRCERHPNREHNGHQLCGYHFFRVEKLVITDGVLHETFKGNKKLKGKS